MQRCSGKQRYSSFLFDSPITCSRNTSQRSSGSSLVWLEHEISEGIKRRGAAHQEERAAAGRAGDAADAALVDDLAGAKHVLAEQRLEAAESAISSMIRVKHARDRGYNIARDGEAARAVRCYLHG